jgi:hypothetical protein
MPLLKVEAPPQPFDAAFRVDDSLLAREKRVALVANLDAKLRLGGPGGVCCAAGADHLSFSVVSGMDFGFHFLNFPRCP